MEHLFIYLQNHGFDIDSARIIVTGVFLLGAFVLVMLIELFIRKFLLKILTVFAMKTTTRFDDILLKHRTFVWFARIVPPVVLHNLVTIVLVYYPGAIRPAQSAVTIYLTVVVVIAVVGLLDALLEFYNENPISSRIPLKSFSQILKTIVISSGVVIVIAMMLGTSPLVFFSGLGAFTAVIILIFKDSILGFVAGIQVSVNNLVQVGDWIEMPKYDADGDVVDISLVTVSVQNWDKTITVIPSYALISEGFRNWRGMSESGGRRIRRSIIIDMRSVQFCDQPMIEKLQKVFLLRDYLASKTKEIADYNRSHHFDASVPVNGRRLTNLGTFRAYVLAYLRNHPKISREMTLLVRHLQPTENGIPLEVYVFCNDIAWAHYEEVQADIMDHLLSVLPFFGLQVFQNPSGADIADAVRVGGELLRPADPRSS